MSVYRLYLLEDEQVVRFEEIEASYDADAIDRADTLRGERTAELWQWNRQVARLSEETPRPQHRPAAGRQRSC